MVLSSTKPKANCHHYGDRCTWCVSFALDTVRRISHNRHWQEEVMLHSVHCRNVCLFSLFLCVHLAFVRSPAFLLCVDWVKSAISCYLYSSQAHLPSAVIHIWVLEWYVWIDTIVSVCLSLYDLKREQFLPTFALKWALIPSHLGVKPQQWLFNSSCDHVHMEFRLYKVTCQCPTCLFPRRPVNKKRKKKKSSNDSPLKWGSYFPVVKSKYFKTSSVVPGIHEVQRSSLWLKAQTENRTVACSGMLLHVCLCINAGSRNTAILLTLWYFAVTVILNKHGFHWSGSHSWQRDLNQSKNSVSFTVARSFSRVFWEVTDRYWLILTVFLGSSSSQRFRY